MNLRFTASTASPLGMCPDFAEPYRSGPSTPSRPTHSLVIPAFNEAGRLDEGMGRLRQAVEAGAVDLGRTEVLVVDDGSEDATAAEARRLLSDAPHLRILRLTTHRGKGASVRLGVAQARGATVAFLDADMAILPTQLPVLHQALEHSDVAIGCRELPDSVVDSTRVLRDLGGRGFNHVVNLLTGVHLSDTQCGFKAFRTPAARLLFHWSVIDGFAFDVEILLTARQLGLGVTEVPVQWLRIDGSRIHPVRDPLRMLGDVAAVRFGARRRPPMPAWRLSGASDMDDLSGLLPAGTPTVHHDALVVLLPLCGPAARDELAARLRARRPEIRMHPLSLSLDEVAGMGPVTFSSPPPSV